MYQSPRAFATPILLIIFNRPENTNKVFAEIRKIRPAKLFISADGSREGKSGEKELCEVAREIVEVIDWPCEVSKKYSETNMGCDPHIESAVTWFFEHVDRGIVLEDDCVPKESFFSFCDILLEKYAPDPRVMHINGSNFQFGKKRGDGSYYFSEYPHSWGWATWRRAWAYYDSKMESFPTFEHSNKIDRTLSTPQQRIYWLKFFRYLHRGKYPFWDSRWAFAIWSSGGACITPNVNMISNVGYGAGASHTFLKDKLNQKSEEMAGLSHPSSVIVDTKADEYTYSVYYYRSFIQKVIYHLFSFLT
jgi:hypothetical protein